MSDITPGKETTEYKIAKALGIAGVSLQPIAGVLAAVLPASSVWVAAVTAIAGALIAIAGALGYQIPRAQVKATEVQAKAATEVAKINPLQPKPSAPTS